MRAGSRCAFTSSPIQARPENCSRTGDPRARGFYCADDLFHRGVANSEMSNSSVVVPALNEEEPIARVIRECLATGVPKEVIVVDNGSTDRTAERARGAGARVVTAPRGYGRACAAGIRALSPECEIVVFLDGDGSDVPAFMNQLVHPIPRGTHDFVIGSRTRGQPETCSMDFQHTLFCRISGLL